MNRRRLCLGAVCVEAWSSSPLLPHCLGDASLDAAALGCLAARFVGGSSRLLRNMLLDLYALCAAAQDAVMLARRGHVAVLAPRRCRVEQVVEEDGGWRARLGCGGETIVLGCRLLGGEEGGGEDARKG